VRTINAKKKVHFTSTSALNYSNENYSSRKLLTKAERTTTSVTDLIQKLPATECENYYFEITKSGANVKVKTVLKSKTMTILYFQYPKMLLKYA